MSTTSAFDAAARALRHRDRSTSNLGSFLAERGYGEDEIRGVLDTMARTGVLDDARYAENRARALAERGSGDALIRDDLVRAGVETEEVEAALHAVEPEHARAERIVARRGVSARTARYLAGKGFAEDVVRGVIAHAASDALG